MKTKILVVLLLLTSLACSEAEFSDAPSSLAYKEKAVVINEGAEYTKASEVTLHLQGGYAQEMFISTDPNCANGVWEKYQRTKTWRLKQLNDKAQVYVKYRTDKKNTNSESKCVSDSIIHDEVPPLVSFQNPTGVINNTSTNEVGFDVSDNYSGVTQVECSLDGEAYTECHNLFRATDLSEGEHTLQVIAHDKAGNESKPTHYKWSVDRTPPEIELLKKPEAFTKAVEARFMFRARDAMAGVATVECRLGGRSFRPCGLTRQDFSRLPAGQQQFEIRAVDKAGNTGASVVYKWHIDHRAPVLTWVQKPNAYINARDVSAFKIQVVDEASGVDKIMCAQGNKGFKSCQDSFVLDKLPHGKQQISVRASDKVGNQSAPQKYTWYVDGTPPKVHFDADKSTPVASNKNSSLVYFRAEDAGAGVKELLCSQDNSRFAACKSPVTYKNLSNGKHALFVKAVDKVGNSSEAVSYAWRVDTDAPRVLITNHPAALTQRANALFQFEGSDATGKVTDFICQLKQGKKIMSSRRSCAAGKQNYQDLLAGSYEFTVQARDDVGNLSQPARFEWLVDHTAPSLEWVSRPAVYISDVQRSDFSIVAADEHAGVKQILCGLSEDALKECSETFSFGFLPEALHNVYVQVIDNVGNVSPVHSYAWRVDATPPDVVINTQLSAAPFSNNTVSEVYFDAVDKASGVKQSLCSVRGQDFAPCSSPASYSTSQSGTYSMKVKAIDNVGNESEAVEYHWQVDLSLPVVSLLQRPDTMTKKTEATFGFKAEDQEGDVKRFECRILKEDKTVHQADCQSPYIKQNLDENAYMFEVVAYDVAGNKSLPAQYEWKIDLSPPAVNWLLKPPAYTGPREVAKFAVRASDSLSGVRDILCGLSPSKLTPCGESFSFDSVQPGPAQAYVQAVDKVGNVSTVHKYEWFVDGQPPVVSFDRARSTRPSPQKPSAVIYFQATDEDSGVKQVMCSRQIDARTFRACQSPLKFTRMASGHYNVYVKAVDKVGNISEPVVYSWAYDGEAPRVEITSHPALTTSDTQAAFKFRGVDDSGNIKQYTCALFKQGQVVRSESICTAPYEYDNLDQGMYQFIVKAEDDSGNISRPVSFDWRVDHTGPQIKIQGPHSVFKNEGSKLTLKVDNLADVDVATVRCYLNDKPLSYCRLDQPVHFENRDHGWQKFRIELADQVGNKGTSHFEWSVNRRFSNQNRDLDVDGIRAVDILFILDNSSSMAEEHRGIADKIDGFLKIVDGLDYHIALTTTDMEHLRRDGANGTLHKFMNESYHIDTSLHLFDAQEFLSRGFKKVGIGGALKEEGISAALSLLQRSVSESTQVKDLRVKEFIRDQAHLAVVLLSDSDQPKRGAPRGSDLLHFINNTWPQKRFVWNSIIAIEGDKKCKGEKKGRQYAGLSEATNGIIGSVCAKNYAAQLEDIGERVLALVTQITLDCKPEDVDKDGRVLEVSRFDPENPNTLIPYAGEYKVVDRQVNFDQFLEAGRYKLEYQCYDE